MREGLTDPASRESRDVVALLPGFPLRRIARAKRTALWLLIAAALLLGLRLGAVHSHAEAPVSGADCAVCIQAQAPAAEAPVSLALEAAVPVSLRVETPAQPVLAAEMPAVAEPRGPPRGEASKA